LSEVVYADERRLRVFDGVDGTVVFETEVGSATRLEYPIVADVDIDGKAEIVVVANEISGVAEPNRSTCSSRGMLASRASAFHPTVFAMPVRPIY